MSSEEIENESKCENDDSTTKRSGISCLEAKQTNWSNYEKCLYEKRVNCIDVDLEEYPFSTVVE